MPAQPEFLDEYLDVADWQPRRPRDAWRRGKFAEQSFLLSLSVLQVLANDRRTAQISMDVERLAWIEQSLKERGVDQPLVLVVDRAGRLGLKDGHHRVLIASRLGWSSLPVRLERSDRLRSHGVPAHDVLGDLLRAWWNLADTQARDACP